MPVRTVQVKVASNQSFALPAAAIPSPEPMPTPIQANATGQLALIVVAAP